MKKLLLTLAALPAATMAVEASAQTYANTGGTAGIDNRIANLEVRFQAAMNAGVLTNAEQMRINNRLGQLRAMRNQYAYNGLSSGERSQLQTQIRAIRQELRSAGGNGWANRYGWSDRDFDSYPGAYGQAYGSTGYTYDQYGRRVPVQGQVYDQYGRPIPNTGYSYDQYGRPVANGGYYGQGGPYEPGYTQPRNNGGIGNVLGGVLGGVLGSGGGAGGILGSILGNGGLSVGSVITSAIASALGGGSSYGYQDRGNTYFRSDGQRVYEIDARTNTVVRIHPLR